MVTLTRRYFETLIDLYSKLTLVKKHEVSLYLEAKRDLYNLITRIQKFNLFEFTYSESFLQSLCSSDLDDLLLEKIELINELHYELYTCLHTRRLHYGGELMQYMLKLKLILFQLPVEELSMLNAIIKIPEDYYYPHELGISNEQQKAEAQAQFEKQLKEWPTKHDKTKIKRDYYLQLEHSLTRIIVDYQEYIFNNYPWITNEFSFFKRKVRGYLTQAMSNDEYEFRIYAYEPTDGDYSIQVVREYYDFCPSYFYNLEEITDRQVFAMVSGLQKKNTALKGLLDYTFIHRELMEIFIRLAGEADMVKFIQFLLKCDNYYLQEDRVAREGYRFDLQGRLDGHLQFFEIYHRVPRSTAVIAQKVAQMKTLQPKGRIIFLFTSRPEEQVYEILKQQDVDVLLLYDLYERHFRQNNSHLLHWYIQSALPDTQRTAAKPGLTFEGTQLIERLKHCEPGERYWSTFEQIGIQIFHFLFADNFRVYLTEIQSENSLGNHRRDLIVSNNFRESSSFWAEMKQQYNCAAIIVDFKNYSAALTANTLYSVSKYTTKNVGNFGIVFSRKGLEDTAVKEQLELFKKGTLLIEFSDIELIGMIQEKMVGKDPIDRLDSKKFQLVKRA